MRIQTVDRVTVTLPHTLVVDIDRHDNNRSRFVAEAVTKELERLRLAQFMESLENPHPETLALADQGLGEWASLLPEEDGEALLEPGAGSPVRWIPGEGWIEA